MILLNNERWIILKSEPLSTIADTRYLLIKQLVYTFLSFTHEFTLYVHTFKGNFSSGEGIGHLNHLPPLSFGPPPLLVTLRMGPLGERGIGPPDGATWAVPSLGTQGKCSE